MRVTLDLDEGLIEAAKDEAARTGVTLASLIEDGLRRALGRTAAHEKREMPTFSGKPRAGIDLTRTSELLDDVEGPFHRP